MLIASMAVGLSSIQYGQTVGTYYALFLSGVQLLLAFSGGRPAPSDLPLLFLRLGLPLWTSYLGGFAYAGGGLDTLESTASGAQKQSMQKLQTQAITVKGYVSLFGKTTLSSMNWTLAFPTANLGAAIKVDSSGNFSFDLPNQQLLAAGNVLTINASNDANQTAQKQFSFAFAPTPPALSLALKDGDTLSYRFCLWASSEKLTFNQCTLLPEQKDLGTFVPSNLKVGEAYFWKIIAEDGKGGTTDSPTEMATARTGFTRLTGRPSSTAPARRPRPSTRTSRPRSARPARMRWRCRSPSGCENASAVGHFGGCSWGVAWSGSSGLPGFTGVNAVSALAVNPCHRCGNDL